MIVLFCLLTTAKITGYTIKNLQIRIRGKIRVVLTKPKASRTDKKSKIGRSINRVPYLISFLITAMKKYKKASYQGNHHHCG